MALNPSESNGGDTVSGTVTLKDKFNINLGAALPSYDVAPAVAYRSTLVSGKKQSLMALVCDPQLPLRADKIPALQMLDTRMLLKPHDWGVSDWPIENRRCPIVIVDRPLGPRVMPSLDTHISPMNEDLITRLLIRPAAEFLELIGNKNLTHRAIRPDNIFYRDVEQTRMVLGDCSSSPPAIAQPAVFETIESGMALPVGRGDGSSTNDLYSLGVTILSLLIGHVPMAKLTDEQVIEEKLTHGSYNALVGRERVSLTMMEVLRGLLNDDPKERWATSDLVFWSDGLRQNPKPRLIPNKANRPFVFNGNAYQTPRELANAFVKNWDAAVTPIKDGSLNVWLRRGFSDEALIETVNDAMIDPVVADRADDALVAKVCIALDPDAPLRYRKLRATVEGLGMLIGHYLEDDDMRDSFAQVMREQLYAYWQRNQARISEAQQKFVADYDRSRNNLDRIGLGLGVERVAYDLNSNLPCRSPILTNDYVIEADQLLPALEHLATSGVEFSSLVDRNMAAFLASKMERHVQADLRDLDNKVDLHVPLIASVKILSTLQERVAKTDFVDLAGAVATMLGPSVERFHSRTVRKRVRDGLKKATRTGRLSHLVGTVNDPRNVAADAEAFKQASAAYAQTVMEDQWVEYEKTNREYFAREKGAQMAATVSGVITCIASVLIFVFMMLF